MKYLLILIPFLAAAQPSVNTINLGAAANDRTGDVLRTAGAKINANFTNLWRAIYTNAPVNVKERGAYGNAIMNDSSWPPTYTAGTNDTAVIQQAIDDVLAAGGGTVYLPKGTYTINAPLTIRKAGQSRIQLKGDGANASRIVGDMSQYLLEISSPATGDANKNQNISLVDIGFANKSSITNAGLIKITDAKWINMHRVVGWGGHVGLEISALSELSAVACNFNNQSWAGLHTRYANGNPAPDLAASSFVECNFINSSTYAAVLDYFRHLQFYSGGISSQLTGVSAGVWIRGKDAYCNTVIFRDVSFESEPGGTTPAIQIGQFDGSTTQQIDHIIIDHCYLGTISKWCKVGAVNLTQPVVMRDCNFFGNIANAAPLYQLTTNAIAGTNQYSFRLKTENCFPAIELYIKDERSSTYIDPKLTQFWPPHQNDASDTSDLLGLDWIEGNDVPIADTTSTNVITSVATVAAKIEGGGSAKFITLPFTRSGQYVTLPIGTVVYAEAIVKWSNAYPPQIFGWRRPDYNVAYWGNAAGAYEVYMAQDLPNNFKRVFAKTTIIEPTGYNGITINNQNSPTEPAWILKLAWYAEFPHGDSSPTIRSTTRFTRGYAGPGLRFSRSEVDGVAFTDAANLGYVTTAQGWIASPWVANAAVTRGDLITSSNNLYVCTVTGTNHNSTVLSGTTAGIVNGTATYNYLLASPQTAILKPFLPWVTPKPSSSTSAGHIGLQAFDTGLTWPMTYVHDGNNWFQQRVRLIDSTLTYPDYAFTNVAPAAMTSPGRLGAIMIDTSTTNKYFYIHDGNNWHRATLTTF